MFQVDGGCVEAFRRRSSGVRDWDGEVRVRGRWGGRKGGVGAGGERWRRIPPDLVVVGIS